ncbi:homocysteine biosynthesis protein [bacterium]|nr:homocysteine biosynthesis protein [bacterium]
MKVKTYEEINQRIRNGEAVVVTAEEIIDIVEEKGIKKAAKEVDVVTTGTFAPMCSSGAFINFGHSKPKIRAQKVWLNGINAYAGLAATDVYLGATELPDEDLLNKVFPGSFKYGGGHVIEDLVAGRHIKLKAISYGTDCYPKKELETVIDIKSVNQAILTNPRNAYQNYNVAINKYSDRTIYTYMGILRPKIGNANYCSTGQLSPLLNDPFYKTIGIGTKIFLGGGEGYVYWEGTQHNPRVKRGANGVVRAPAGTLAVVGDLKGMSPEWLKGTSITGYGASLTVGIGIPIPILSEDIVKYTAVKDEDIYTQIVDYSKDYPNGVNKSYGEVNYKQLRDGYIEIEGKQVPTGALSSYKKAREIAEILKDRIKKKKFELAKPVKYLKGKLGE